MERSFALRSFPVHQVVFLSSPIHALSVPVRIGMVSEGVVSLFRSLGSVRRRGRVDAGGAARGWMGLVFQRGRDWETKDPSEGWAAGTLKRLWGGEVGLLRVVSQEVEVDKGAGRRCGGPRVDGRVAGRRAAEERRRSGVPGLGTGRVAVGGFARPVDGGISTRGWDGGSDGYPLDSVRSVVLGSREVDGERVKPLAMMTESTEWRVEEGKKGVEKDCKGELNNQRIDADERQPTKDRRRRGRDQKEKQVWPLIASGGPAVASAACSARVPAH